MIPTRNRAACALAAIAVAGLAAPAAAQDAPPEDFWSALRSGEVWLKLRWRFENVDQEGISKQANASTLRTVLGYETARWKGWAGLVEFEDVSPVGEDLYNSTINGRTDRPVVADPDSAEVNQAYASWANEQGVEVRLGRQRITLDNHRFIGNVGWRQNEQTYDAVSASGLHLGAVDVFYAFLFNVNRIFGNESPVGDAQMASHLVHLALTPWENAKLVGYGYYLDYDDNVALSSLSTGLRLDGKYGLSDDVDLLYTAEFANQTDVGDNPLDLSETYYLVNVGAAARGFEVRVGNELLGGSGDPAQGSFQTPLATLHGQNGWADKFLSTPLEGLEDVSVSVGWKRDALGLKAIWHDFSSDAGSIDYGTELDLVATYRVREDLSVGVKYADYSADERFTDTQKGWLWLGWAF